jgi:hypothetical protein
MVMFLVLYSTFSSYSYKVIQAKMDPLSFPNSTGLLCLALWSMVCWRLLNVLKTFYNLCSHTGYRKLSAKAKILKVTF